MVTPIYRYRDTLCIQMQTNMYAFVYVSDINAVYGFEYITRHDTYEQVLPVFKDIHFNTHFINIDQ